MDTSLLISRVLDDEGLTAGLDEEDASYVVRLVVAHVESLARHNAESIASKVENTCRRTRRIVEVVVALRDQGESAARSVAATHEMKLSNELGTPTTLLRSLLSHLND